MAKILEEGPIRKILREKRFLEREGKRSPEVDWERRREAVKNAIEGYALNLVVENRLLRANLYDIFRELAEKYRHV